MAKPKKEGVEKAEEVVETPSKLNSDLQEIVDSLK
jgi:hypothetical protein